MQNKTNFLNKLSKMYNMGKIELRKNISKKELKYNNKAFLNPLKPKKIYKNNNKGSYIDKSNILINIIIIFLLISLTNEILLFRQLNYLSSITITFKETGTVPFLNQNYILKPDYVLVNDKERDFEQSGDGKYTILLEENEYTIKLGWNDLLTSCSNMFNGLQEIKSIDLSEFDTSNVIDMSSMFSECTNLESLDLRNLKLSSVTNLDSMFKSCSSLKEIDLSNLDATSVTTMSSMFFNCTSLTYINLSNIKLGSLKDMSYLFYQCESLSRINLLNLNTETVETMSHMFSGCQALKSLNLSDFDTSSVKDMEEMFSNNYLLESLDLSNFNTQNLYSMKRMFYKCQNLIFLELSGVDTSSVTDMSEVFLGCSNLVYLNISNFRTTGNTLTNGTFKNCEKLKSLILPSEIKLASKSMKSMFQGCKSLTSLNLSHFDTSSVTSMESMFQDCAELIYINMSEIDTSSVKTMKFMFKNCQKLERMDLSNLNLKTYPSMNGMFIKCKSLLFLNLKQLKLNGIDLGSIFQGIPSENIKLCYNESLANTIKNDYSSFANDCENYCFKESTKLISELNKCVDECNIDGNKYIYEFNNKCYIKCPEDTTSSNYICIKNISCKNYTNIDRSQCFESVPEGFYIYNNNNKIIDECYKNCKTCNKKGYDDNNNCLTCKDEYFFENGNCVDKLEYSSFINVTDNEEISSLKIKCKKYSDESLQNGLCITCNEEEGYYPKYSERLNDFNNCYQSLKGYYLMNGYFFSCYETCDECLTEGNEYQHNCTACKKGYKFINEIDRAGNCYQNCEYFYYLNESNKYQCTPLNQCPVNKSKLVEEKKKCVHNCKDDDTFKFEYNNKCYQECPEPENKIIEDNICINKTEGKNTGIITDKNGKEDLENPTSHIIQITDKIKNEVITDNIITSTNKEEEIITNNIITSTNKEEEIITNNIVTSTNKEEEIITHKIITSTNKEEEIITDNIIASTNKEEKKITDNIVTSTNKEEEIITNNIITSTNKEEEIITDNIVTSTNKEEEIITNNIKTSTNKEENNISTYDTQTNIPTSKVDQSTEIIIDKKTQNNEEKWSVENFILGLSNEDSKDIINKDDIIKNINYNIINHKIDSLLSNVTFGNKNDLCMKEENVLYQITTTENQNNNIYNNISTIKLGKCEDILREKYNISSNLSLIIFKIDYYMEGLLIPIIGYEVYEPINKTKLDLSYCEESSISYNIPVSIDENNLFKYNPNSEYYNDECNSYTTENGTDIILNDRKEDFIENNMSLCENLCDYMGYDTDSKKALCECGIRYKEFILSEIDKETNILSNNFTKDDTTSNLGAMKCYQVVFSKEGLSKNIGSYILFFIIIIHIISTILFYKCGYYFLESSAKNIIKTKMNLKSSKSGEIIKNEIKSKVTNFSQNQIPKKKKIIKVKKKVKKNIANPLKRKNSKKSIYINQLNININSSDSKSLNKLKLKDMDIFSYKTKQNLNNNKMKKSNYDIKNEKTNKYLPLDNFSDFELNIMKYNDAQCIDNRTYFQYYLSLLKSKHPITFTFCSNKDYNLLIIKICLFSLSFAIYYLFNAIFFSYSIIHIIYKEGGSYNLSYLFPIIIYAFLISYYINVIIKLFLLSERSLLEIKNQKSIKQMKSLVSKVLKCLSIKYTSYFIISIISLILLWYYISSFGAVFQNSQVYLIKNTFISFSLGFIYPFLICLLPGIFRIYSLRTKNGDFIYKISIILQNLS